MRIQPPKPFMFEGGPRAVLLLHGFTGNSADVRMLGRYLNDKGYTCHAPIYRGHGTAAEELVKYTPEDWWQDVMDAYQFLKNKGYEEIAVAGLSLGGVFSLKLGYTVPVKGIVPMCAPMDFRSDETVHNGVLYYAREYKQFEKKTQAEIEAEMAAFDPKPLLKQLNGLIQDVRDHVDLIYAPLFVVQARHDGMINTNSANIIYNEAESVDKKLKWYEESGHTITFDVEKDQLHEDVYAFLESLDWKE
ncbi:carboxylesterase [Bacillus sp. FJAT-27225]|uniref:alpha/beta hydrolase n=1 Tax=Bacillus sp. FJAT-27225 TaxID=1743144 RepID=UPI00080C2FA7|nr:carboxylesterase [Bacillus sp. FJAT-27225]OCA88157.1 carboxylesterase [Bacillus sp. FJAT-27225]